MLSDIEDEIGDEKNPIPLDEDDDISPLKSSILGEFVEENGSTSENLKADCGVHCNDSNTAEKTLTEIFSSTHVTSDTCSSFERDYYFGTSDTCSSFERLEEHTCIVCNIADNSAIPCFGNERPLAVHRKWAELDCADYVTSYCPYCWYQYLAAKSMALRTMVDAAAKAVVHHKCTKPKNSGDIDMARENIQPENDSDKSLPMQLHVNLFQLREVVDKLKAHNIQLEESVDQVVDMEKAACGEASVVVHDQPKRILWTAKEEHMLRVGVETFSATIKKNMPWKKILEMGKAVFHKHRTPSDLKDKWRKMMM